MGAMDWLKGIMGPSAQFPGQQAPGMGGSPLGGLAGMAGAALGSPLGNPLGGMGGMGGMGGAPPFGGAPGGDPYGGGMGGPPMGGAPPMGAPGGYVPPGDAFASNAGYGGGMAPMGAPPGNPYASAPGMSGGGTGREAALEAQVAELRHDVEALALFSRTLLTVMLERKILSVEQFQESKNKIDMLDGKLDERVAKGA